MKKILFLTLFLIGCTAEPVVTEEIVESDRSAEGGIEGTWKASGTVDDGAFDWYVEFYFEDGEYSTKGYPPTNDKGTYEVREGFITFTSEQGGVNTQTFALSEDGQTLDMGGTNFVYVK